MFGTLVSTDFDRGTLEFVENSDPVAAVSRNLQEKVHIACTQCRYKKVRCSGGRRRCQRCIAMGLDCVYPESQARHKRQGDNHKRQQSKSQAHQRKQSLAARMVRNASEPGTAGNQSSHDEPIDLNDSHDLNFDHSCIDESLFSPWMKDTHVKISASDGGWSSSSSGNPSSVVSATTSPSPFSPRSRSTTSTLPLHVPEPSSTDPALTSLLTPSGRESVGEQESWEGLQGTHGDLSWVLNSDRQSAIGSTSDPLLLDTWDRSSIDSGSCNCLLSSISFLERLVSRSASREDRIDLLLSDVRSSIETLGTFVACEKCELRVEQNILLAMAARQISVLCVKTANCYKILYLSSRADASTSQQTPELDAMAGALDISVSTYRVSRRERLHILRSLVSLQIVEFQQNLDKIKTRYCNRPNQSQAEALLEAENHIKSARVAVSCHS